MPAITPLILEDDTPTSMTFAPVSSNGNTATFRTNSEVSRDLERAIKVTVSENKSRQRVAMKLTSPVTSSDAAGETVVSDEVLVEVQLMSPHSANDADRATVVQLAKDALDQALIKSVFEDGEGLW